MSTLTDAVKAGRGAVTTVPSATGGVSGPNPVAYRTRVSPAATGLSALVTVVAPEATRSAATWPEPEEFAVKIAGLVEETGSTSGALRFPFVETVTEVFALPAIPNGATAAIWPAEA